MTALVTGVLQGTGLSVEGRKTQTVIKTVCRVTLFSVGAVLGFNIL